MVESNLQRLRSVLDELFMLDRADLDFGIYRIMNVKREEIGKFLDQDLLPQVKAALNVVDDGQRVQAKEELDKAVEQAKGLGVDPDNVPRIAELRARYNAGTDLDALEGEVFSHLASFFRRYYREGDFLSLRRYKEGVYAIPYEGEEVKLHWANADQYYIKSSEQFRDYAFKLPDGRRVHFNIASAAVEKDNNQAANGQERRFLLSGTDTISEVDGELVIRFEYKADADGRRRETVNAETEEKILSSAPDHWKPALQTKAPTEKNPDRRLLAKHISDYTARNTFDYFIHKDLGTFLRRELDFYIKNEVVHLDDIQSETAPRVEQYLAKIKALRQVAHKLIAFLAQLEDFQKKLWLKKKFVVETQYCVTVDIVPTELLQEVCESSEQLQEWIRLFAIDEIPPGLTGPKFTAPVSLEFLQANPFLVVDTRFFNSSFKERLLASFDSIHDRTNGILIRGDNFHGLRLLNELYRGQIQCIYIDPPYNTGPTEILYKNDYKNASWLSLMENRLTESRPLLEADGVVVIAIDDFEMPHLCEMVDWMLPSHNRSMVVVNHHPQGGYSSNITRTHEYALFMIPEDEDLLQGRRVEDDVELRPFMRSGTAENNFRYGRPNSFYAILVDPNTMKVVGVEEPPQGSDYSTERTTQGQLRVYPLGKNGTGQTVERVWRLSYPSAVKAVQQERIVARGSGTIYQRIMHEGRRAALFSNWTDKRYNAGTHGTNLVRHILGAPLFSYPKSLYTVRDAIESVTSGQAEALVLDYFAGSGTTGHAVLDLNREDDGDRRYVMIEMGDYFDTVLKPRMEKVIYSAEWKDGKPSGRNGSSHMFKYLKLESYEDTLNNLDFLRTDLQASLLDEAESFKEEYLLRYMLELESKGSASLLSLTSFDDPFNYTLNIATSDVGQTQPVPIDIIETFNLLLGLRVRTFDNITGYKVVTGETNSGEQVLAIWRNVREKSNTDLDAFFRKQDYRTLDREFDLIYVNGDNNLENLRRDDETWKVRLIEEEFLRLMFDVRDL